MQLIPRYLVNNTINLVANEAGFVTEYRPVYTRHIKIYKNIDNTIQFRLLNADQKPLDVSGYTPKFVAFDDNGTQVIAHDGSITQLDDSSASRGKFTVTITENDTLNLKQQYLKYNVYLVDSNNEKVITYSFSNFEHSGIIYLDGSAYPGPVASQTVTTFTEDLGLSLEDDSVWYSEAITAEPAINGNEALHTLAIYTNAYAGNVVVQATLENTITGSNNWADLTTLAFTGLETEPVTYNFNGVVSYVRFKCDQNPADKITKILLRN